MAFYAKSQQLVAMKLNDSEAQSCQPKIEHPLDNVRPTLSLRVETKDGYSIIIRAMLDTAAFNTIISLHLAHLLITNGNARKVSNKYFQS